MLRDLGDLNVGNEARRMWKDLARHSTITLRRPPGYRRLTSLQPRSSAYAHTNTLTHEEIHGTYASPLCMRKVVTRL